MAEISDKCVCSCTGGLLTKELTVAAAHLLFWPFFLIGFAADLWTKSAVFNWLGSHAPQRYGIIDGFFQFVLVENLGAAWGMAAGKTMSLVVISIVAIIIVFSIFLFGQKLQMVVVLALGLFAAGICGNLYDRLFNDGRVRDFLDFYYKDWHFPAFNLADSMLTVAVCILIMVTLFCRKKENQMENSNE